MIVLAPFPSIEESLAYFSPPWLTYVTKATIYQIRTYPKRGLWTYHHHFLCTYGLKGVELLEPRVANIGTLLLVKYSLQERQKEVKDTGPPEWWGNERIHRSHRNFLKYHESPWNKKFDKGWLVEPTRDFDQIELSLRPILEK